MTEIQLRRASAATAASNNVTLASGEVGVETDTGKFKIGDGSTSWNQLHYATDISRLPDAVVNTGGGGLGGVPVTDANGGYSWAPLAFDPSGFVGSTLADTASVHNANSEYFGDSGKLIMTACVNRAPASKLVFEVDQPGSGLTTGANLLGIYDGSGVLVMSAGDMTSLYSGNTTDTVMVVDLPSTLPPGFYFVAQLNNGTTPPYLTGAYVPMVTEIGTKVMTPPRVSYGSSVYASLPTSVDWDADGFSANSWVFVTFFALLP